MTKTELIKRLKEVGWWSEFEDGTVEGWIFTNTIDLICNFGFDEVREVIEHLRKQAHLDNEEAADLIEMYRLKFDNIKSDAVKLNEGTADPALGPPRQHKPDKPIGFVAQNPPNSEGGVE